MVARAHRGLVFSSRGRRHAARPVPNLSRFRGKLPKVSTPSTQTNAKNLVTQFANWPFSRFPPLSAQVETQTRFAAKKAVNTQKRELGVAHPSHPADALRAKPSSFFHTLYGN